MTGTFSESPKIFLDPDLSGGDSDVNICQSGGEYGDRINSSLICKKTPCCTIFVSPSTKLNILVQKDFWE